jgi:hypothetical protein
MAADNFLVGDSWTCVRNAGWKEGASGEPLPISHVRVRCVSVISKVFIDLIGKLVVEAINI